MPLSPAERIAAYRARQKKTGEPDSSRRNRKEHKKKYVRQSKTKKRPFVGCDGEGAGVDEKGRQNFLLFRMGDRELFNNNERLTTWQLLNFICDAPKEAIYVGFAFGYDITMILRDLSPVQQRRLFEPKTFGEGHSPFVWYKDFDIDYLPRNYLRVRRVKIVRQPDGSEKREVVKGSTRTIFETFGFFQKSFLKVCKEFGVGTPEQLDMIARNKDRRSEFVEMDQEERDYCKLECEFLAELMEKLRDYCADANINPRTWSGAGKLAAALHNLQKTMKSADVAKHVPQAVLDMANMAYYGGRFEITRTGHINHKVYERDIRSAYPAAMRKLPCLEHGTWEKLPDKLKAADQRKLMSGDNLYVANVRFKCKPVADEYGQLGGFPVRSKEGHLYWPLRGAGVYWSPEIESATALGFNVQLCGGWKYERNCNCHPFDWVEPLFDYRRSIGSSGPGYPIKLAINSLYGKLAQRKGNGAYNNMVWAGLITAYTRATLNYGISLSPGRIVMLATDALYSLEPLPLPTGEKLGEWEEKELPDLFIVQPGLYWSPGMRKAKTAKPTQKSRGLSGKFFEEAGRTEAFEQAWRDFQARDNSGLDLIFPSVTVPVPGFIGLKLAIARNKPELAGTWIEDSREISFDWRNKRTGHKWDGGAIITKPKLGDSACVSIPHRDFLAAGGQEPWEAARLMLEEQPDFIDLGAPFKD